MTSVNELRARIEEATSSIQLHQDAIRALVRSKSDLQGQLNAIVDPLALLPFELSSQIFFHCLSHMSPMVLLGICRSWRSIALGIPALWTTLSITSPRTETASTLCDEFLKRAGPLPLTLCINGSIYKAAEDLLERYAERLEDLDLSLSSGEELSSITTVFTALKSLSISQGYHQRYLTYTEDYYSDDASECVKMLCLAPNLLRCTFGLIFYARRRQITEDQPTWTHGSLKHLHLGYLDLSNECDNSAQILNYLTSPALESLSISYFDIRTSDFIDFLIRSSPPLNCLALAIRKVIIGAGWTENAVDQVFQLLPKLTHLDLKFEGGSLAEFFDLFIIQALRALPSLCDLTIRPGSCALTRPHWERLIQVLRTSPRMRSVRLLDPTCINLDPDTMVALRELRNAGMDIRVDLEESNNV
ncbi:hypothetical protein B0H16DRAFT_1703874 [Mycena metata]|uniref:F-box domain-containing protein n=1 Tax=Mycena metata TaxID=1033252 RepID=A0AAD7H0M3_9AGAR|nr:hypothetical protein B0H16DRAFT_1703874 [Mycena metata]